MSRPWDWDEETLCPKSRIKWSEYIRIITEALYSSGFDKTGKTLEEESGIPLYDPIVKQYLQQVKNGEWEKSIATLESFHLGDEKAVKSASFLLQEQKFFDFLNTDHVTDALSTLREKLMPLGVNIKRVHELASKLISDKGQDTVRVKSRLDVVKEVEELLPYGLIIPPKRLENILEWSLNQSVCDYHNILDSDMSLLCPHDCKGHKIPSKTVEILEEDTDHVHVKIPSKTVQILEEHKDEVWFLKFSHNGKYLASFSKDKSAIIWEMSTEGKFLMKHKLEGHERPVVTILWSPDDRQVITCGENEVIRSWDVDSGEFIQLYEIDSVHSVYCGWLHDGSGIIGAMTDRSICLWELDGTWIEIERVLGCREEKISDVAMTTDGKWLVSVSKPNQISLFDKETRITILITEEATISSFSLSKDNRNLLINLITDKIHLWDLEGVPSMKMEFTGLKCHGFVIRSCFGGYRESFIASGSADFQIYIWSTELPDKPCLVLLGHSGVVNCVSWSPTDLHMLASASDDRTIRIWGLDNE